MIRTMKLLFLLLFASARFEVEVEVEVGEEKQRCELHNMYSSRVSSPSSCLPISNPLTLSRGLQGMHYAFYMDHAEPGFY